MRIGVLTLPLHNNFGGILQAYALQKVLKKQGHKSTLIDLQRYVSIGPWYKRYPIYIKRGINRYILGKDIIVKADAVNTLNETAYAAQHVGDTYFANSNLEA